MQKKEEVFHIFFFAFTRCRKEGRTALLEQLDVKAVENEKSLCFIYAYVIELLECFLLKALKMVSFVKILPFKAIFPTFNYIHTFSLQPFSIDRSKSKAQFSIAYKTRLLNLLILTLCNL